MKKYFENSFKNKVCKGEQTDRQTNGLNQDYINIDDSLENVECRWMMEKIEKKYRFDFFRISNIQRNIYFYKFSDFKQWISLIINTRLEAAFDTIRITY